MQAIELCVARFDEDTKFSFIDLYTKIDAGVITGEEEENKNPLREGLEENNAF
jgi:hypothetical protein